LLLIQKTKIFICTKFKQ